MDKILACRTHTPALYAAGYGAVRGALSHAREVVETETGSATDNPMVFRRGEIYPAQFSRAPLALAFDYAASALTDLASITSGGLNGSQS